jgi:hypothetical protein
MWLCGPDACRWALPTALVRMPDQRGAAVGKPVNLEHAQAALDRNAVAGARATRILRSRGLLGSLPDRHKTNPQEPDWEESFLAPRPVDGIDLSSKPDAELVPVASDPKVQRAQTNVRTWERTEEEVFIERRRVANKEAAVDSDSSSEEEEDRATSPKMEDSPSAAPGTAKWKRRTLADLSQDDLYEALFLDNFQSFELFSYKHLTPKYASLLSTLSATLRRQYLERVVDKFVGGALETCQQLRKAEEKMNKRGVFTREVNRERVLKKAHVLLSNRQSPTSLPMIRNLVLEEMLIEVTERRSMSWRQAEAIDAKLARIFQGTAFEGVSKSGKRNMRQRAGIMADDPQYAEKLAAFWGKKLLARARRTISERAAKELSMASLAAARAVPETGGKDTLMRLRRVAAAVGSVSTSFQARDAISAQHNEELAAARAREREELLKAGDIGPRKPRFPRTIDANNRSQPVWQKPEGNWDETDRSRLRLWGIDHGIFDEATAPLVPVPKAIRRLAGHHLPRPATSAIVLEEKKDPGPVDAAASGWGTWAGGTPSTGRRRGPTPPSVASVPQRPLSQSLLRRRRGEAEVRWEPSLSSLPSVDLDHGTYVDEQDVSMPESLVLDDDVLVASLQSRLQDASARFRPRSVQRSSSVSSFHDHSRLFSHVSGVLKMAEKEQRQEFERRIRDEKRQRIALERLQQKRSEKPRSSKLPRIPSMASVTHLSEGGGTAASVPQSAGEDDEVSLEMLNSRLNAGGVERASATTAALRLRRRYHESVDVETTLFHRAFVSGASRHVPVEDMSVPPCFSSKGLALSEASLSCGATLPGRFLPDGSTPAVEAVVSKAKVALKMHQYRPAGMSTTALTSLHDMTAAEAELADTAHKLGTGSSLIVAAGVIPPPTPAIQAEAFHSRFTASAPKGRISQSRASNRPPTPETALSPTKRWWSSMEPSVVSGSSVLDSEPSYRPRTAADEATELIGLFGSNPTHAQQAFHSSTLLPEQDIRREIRTLSRQRAQSSITTPEEQPVSRQAPSKLRPSSRAERRAHQLDRHRALSRGLGIPQGMRSRVLSRLPGGDSAPDPKLPRKSRPIGSVALGSF